VDVQRPRRRKKIRHALWGLAALGIASVALLVSRLEPRLPVVARSGIWTAKVEESPFVLRVRGPGTLRPEVVRWLTTESSGRVEEVLLKPGMPVEPETPVVRLENLDLRLQAAQAARNVEEARVQLLAHDRQSREDVLRMDAEIVGLSTERSAAQRRTQAYAAMARSIVPELEWQDSEGRAAELEQRERMARERLSVLARMVPLQRLGLGQQLREEANVQKVRDELVQRLVVRAGASGILQDVLVELGQWVVPGTAVAKVIVSRRLQAELRIAAERAGQIQVGQAAQIETGAGNARDWTIRGRVRRVAPAASEGTVLVEVALEGELPDSMRPDQDVDGSIETEHTGVTLHVKRPIGLSNGDQSNLFRLDPDTQVARRVPVRTGRISVDSVEIVSGLAPDDEIILSDMSRFAAATAVQIE
jgi:HlyD family secretion protein